MLLLVLLGIVAVVPPVRAVMSDLWGAMDRAMAAARHAEARDREIGEYVRRYGISWQLADDIERVAREEGVDAELAFRLVRVESAFQERAVSTAGAMGLTQLMPATAAQLQPGITRAEVFDRETNLRLGFRYLKLLLALYDGDVEEALHAYNRGMGTVARIRAAGGDPANGYADMVLGDRGESPVSTVPPHGFTTRPAPPPPPLHSLPPARLPDR